MNKTEAPITHFKLDRTKVKFVDIEDDKIENTVYWLTRPVEERFYAIEFLRHQYMEMNNIPPVMDKTFFELI